MIQIQTMRLSSMNALVVSSRKNIILTNEEAESGAVTADDLGMFYCFLFHFIEAEDDDG
jgi:hypothetical protein